MKKPPKLSIKPTKRAVIILFALIIIINANACAKPEQEPEDEVMIDTRGEVFIENARELEEYFERGPQSAILTADIDMGDTMLKLTRARGEITLHGNGHIITSSASCAIRLEDATSIVLEEIIIEAQKTALGLLGDGRINGPGLKMNAGISTVHAAGDLTIAAYSEIEINSDTGIGLTAQSVLFEDNTRIDVKASTYAIRAGRGGVTLDFAAIVTLRAAGDNCLFSEGDLTLAEDSVLRTGNAGDHNAALVAELFAHPTATIEATGGSNGMGLFIMNQDEHVTLRGFSTPEVMLESGDGSVVFE